MMKSHCIIHSLCALGSCIICFYASAAMCIYSPDVTIFKPTRLNRSYLNYWLWFLKAPLHKSKLNAALASEFNFVANVQLQLTLSESLPDMTAR